MIWTTKKSTRTKNNKTKKLRSFTKLELTKTLYPITLDQAIESFQQLRDTDCKQFNPLDTAGTDFVNHFTSIERLNTKGRLNFSYFDMYYNFEDFYKNKRYFRNAINRTFKNRFFKESDESRAKMLKSMYTLYFGNIGVFRPILVKDLICKYKPKVFLDFTMGWGGRLVGACSENVEKYIGIDLNTNLEPLYKKMIATLKPLTTTKIQLFFKSALDVDYSKLEYDFVFTSPPYYNLEIYNKSAILKKEEWNQTFYIPIFTVTYKHLKKGGHYCLNVPVNIYENACVGILGPCHDKIPLGRRVRNRPDQVDTYNEYIYVWKK
jgi:hypothetical protein